LVRPRDIADRFEEVRYGDQEWDLRNAPGKGAKESEGSDVVGATRERERAVAAKINKIGVAALQNCVLSSTRPYLRWVCHDRNRIAAGSRLLRSTSGFGERRTGRNSGRLKRFVEKRLSSRKHDPFAQ